MYRVTSAALVAVLLLAGCAASAATPAATSPAALAASPVATEASTPTAAVAETPAGLASAEAPDRSQALIGRWNLTVQGPDGDYPSWLEVKRSGFRTLVGSFVARVGSARPVAQVHAEFRYPEGSNSGLYLRGRYEMQIMDNHGQPPSSVGIGGIYGFLTPSVNASRPAGQWQTADVTLVGRQVTVVLNGQRIIDRQPIPGMTGGALDNDEAMPRPIMLQGDHGVVEFRRLTLRRRLCHTAP